MNVRTYKICKGKTATQVRPEGIILLTLDMDEKKKKKKKKKNKKP